MKTLRLIPLLLIALFIAAIARAEEPTLPANFVYEDIYKGPGMTAIDFDPSGALFVCQKMGCVILLEPKSGGDFNDPVTILDIKNLVNPDNECGLLGIAIDPQFKANHFVYVFYTTSTDQQLARYTLNPQRTALTDPLILLSGLPRTHTNHKAGDIHFHPKDPNSIYLTLGNDADPNGALIDDPNTYNGKILRVNKANGQGLPDNPFYKGDPNAICARVWCMGLRNPFRFTFTPSGLPANHLYVSENGDGLDRYYQIGKGANGGWNHGGDNGWWKNPPADDDIHILGTHKPSMTGIAIAETGPFASPQGPVLYVSHWYGPDILRGVLGGQDWTTFTPIPSDTDGKFAIKLKCVNLKFGPDGALYTTDTYFGDSAGNGFRLGRIKYDGPPVANTAAPMPAPGAAPEPAAVAAPTPPPAPVGFAPGGSAILKKEIMITLQYGAVRVPTGSQVKLITKTGAQWTAQWGANTFTVSESDLQLR